MRFMINDILSINKAFSELCGAHYRKLKFFPLNEIITNLCKIFKIERLCAIINPNGWNIKMAGWRFAPVLRELYTKILNIWILNMLKVLFTEIRINTIFKMIASPHMKVIKTGAEKAMSSKSFYWYSEVRGQAALK